MKKQILLILFLSFFTLTAIAQKQSFKFRTSNDRRHQTEGTSIFTLGPKTKSNGEITISPPVKKLLVKNDTIEIIDSLETNIIVKGEKYIVECGKIYSVFGRFTKLDVFDNRLNILDVSALTKITYLNCSYNGLNELDVSTLLNLTYLNCCGNRLHKFDVSRLIRLTHLNCSSNRLDSLNVSPLRKLTYLEGNSNFLKELDVSTLTKLTHLNCSENILKILDVTGCIKIKELYCFYNNFSYCALDSLFLTLPQKKSKEKAQMYIANCSLYEFNSREENKCRTYLANDKKWRVVNGYEKNVTEINNTEFACLETANQYFKFKSSGRSFMLSNRTETSGEIRILPPVKNGKRKTDIIEIGRSYIINANTEYTITSNFTKLDISNMQLTSLILSDTINLISFNFSNNELISLDTESLKRLESLNCENNKLTSLDLQNSTNLRELHCYNNKFSVCALDTLFLTLPFREDQDSAKIYFANNNLDNNINNKCRTDYLTERKWKALDFNNNAFSEEINNTELACKDSTSVFRFISSENSFILRSDSKIDAGIITIFPAVKDGERKTNIIKIGNRYTIDAYAEYMVRGNFLNLDVENNELISLSVSGLSRLESLDCSNYRLRSLDVSNMKNLKTIYCYDRRFSVCALDSIFDALPQRLEKDSAKIYISGCRYSSVESRTYIANDKNWRVMETNFYRDSEWEIKNTKFACLESANQYFKFKSSGNSFKLLNDTESSGEILISPSLILGDKETDNIEIGLSYTINPDTEYTITSKFSKLDLSSNHITSLNLSAAGSLTSLNCENNELTSLDVSGLKKLAYFTCNNNQLASLDLLDLKELTFLNCDNNQLTSLELFGLNNLNYLSYINNKLSDLELYLPANLKEIYCYNNKFSACELDRLFLTLPFRDEQDSAKIYLANNNLDNGINNKCRTGFLADRKWKALDFKNDSLSEEIINTEFACKASSPGFKFVSSGKVFRLGGQSSLKKTVITIFPSVKTGKRKTNVIRIGYDYTIDANTEYTVSGDFSMLDVKDNELISLDFMDLKKLHTLSCDNNQLGNLDISGLTKLYSFNCYRNKLTSLDFSGLKDLSILYCSNNKLTNLKVPNLSILYCSFNQISNLDISNSYSLTNLYCHNNKLTSLDVSQCRNLKEIYCGENNFTVCALDSLFKTLSNNTSNNKAKIYISFKGAYNNIVNRCRTYIANDNGWDVLQSGFSGNNEDFEELIYFYFYSPYYRNSDDIEIINTIFDCKETKEPDFPKKEE